MDVIEVIKVVDGGVAVAVLLIGGWWGSKILMQIIDNQNHLIDKLTNGDTDDDTNEN